MIIKKDYTRQQFDKHIATYNKHAYMQKMICKKLVAQLSISPLGSFEKVLEIGCGSGLLTSELLKHFKVDNYIANDIAPTAEKHVSSVLDGISNWSFIAADAENFTFPKGLDLLVSASTIQWFNNLDVFFDHVHEALNIGGVLAFSSFGPNNYCEIRSVLGCGLDYKTREELEHLIKKNFQIISVIEFEQKLNFDSPVQVLKHIKYLGANGIRRQFWSKGQLLEFEKEYDRKFRYDDGGIPLTYHPIIIIAKRL